MDSLYATSRRSGDHQIVIKIGPHQSITKLRPDLRCEITKWVFYGKTHLHRKSTTFNRISDNSYRKGNEDSTSRKWKRETTCLRCGWALDTAAKLNIRTEVLSSRRASFLRNRRSSPSSLSFSVNPVVDEVGMDSTADYHAENECHRYDVNSECCNYGDCCK